MYCGLVCKNNREPGPFLQACYSDNPVKTQNSPFHDHQATETLHLHHLDLLIRACWDDGVVWVFLHDPIQLRAVHPNPSFLQFVDHSRHHDVTPPPLPRHQWRIMISEMAIRTFVIATLRGYAGGTSSTGSILFTLRFGWGALRSCGQGAAPLV